MVTMAQDQSRTEKKATFLILTILFQQTIFSLKSS
jgi:hypothetical protein